MSARAPRWWAAADGSALGEPPGRPVEWLLGLPDGRVLVAVGATAWAACCAAGVALGSTSWVRRARYPEQPRPERPRPQRPTPRALG